MQTISRFIGLMIALSCVVGCKAGQGDPCETSVDCQSGLVCFAPAGAETSFFDSATFAELEPYLEAQTCVGPDDLAEAAKSKSAAAVNCRDQYACKKKGACTSVDGVCVATSDADCRASSVCKAEGWCRVVNGRCAS